jgi:hypothetical protein
MRGRCRQRLVGHCLTPTQKRDRFQQGRLFIQAPASSRPPSASGSFGPIQVSVTDRSYTVPCGSSFTLVISASAFSLAYQAASATLVGTTLTTVNYGTLSYAGGIDRYSTSGKTGTALKVTLTANSAVSVHPYRPGPIVTPTPVAAHYLVFKLATGRLIPPSRVERLTQRLQEIRRLFSAT